MSPRRPEDRGGGKLEEARESTGGAEPVRVLLGLGSNLGDRLGHLRSGVRALTRHVDVRAASRVVETRAHGVDPDADHPSFLNAVVLARCALDPGELLAVCQVIEDQEGRMRLYRNAPRTLDVDILFYGNQVLRTPDLTVPHPRWQEREFVLTPLLDLAEGWRDPESGRPLEDIARERIPGLAEAVTVADGEALMPSDELRVRGPRW